MIPLNTQPIEKREVRDDGALDVHSIFATIQGEGPFAGSPAIFVRLAGCNLQCPLCDTEYTQGRRVMQLPTLFEEIAKCETSIYPPYKPLIVLTGGEPFRQACGQFVRQAHRRSYRVQVETNGTLYDDSMDGVWGLSTLTIVCSPKARINTDLIRHIDALKYVAREGFIDPNDGLPTRALDSTARPGRIPNFSGITYLQPCDEQDEDRDRLSTQAVINSCMKFGHRLCLQVHKIVNLP
jgi:organic radical activating enzyme